MKPEVIPEGPRARRGAGYPLRAVLPVLAFVLLLSASQAASAQCFLNPTGETAVGLRNASSHYLLFFLDGMRMDGVAPGDRSIFFVVAPGEHDLRAEAVIGGETVSASRTVFVPEGHVCTWKVTDPETKSGGTQTELRDSLGRERLRDFAGWRLRRL